MHKDDEAKFEVVEKFTRNHKTDRMLVHFKMLTWQDIQAISIETAEILRQPVSLDYVIQIIGMLSAKYDTNKEAIPNLENDFHYSERAVFKTLKKDIEQLHIVVNQLNNRTLVLSVEDIAEVCHEIKKCYCERVGDMCQTSWKDAPPWQKAVAMDGVVFHLEHPQTTPENSHFIWITKKLDDGWTYGEIKDPEKKEHPCIMPFKDLPCIEKTKSHLFLGVVRALQKYTLD